MKTKLTSAMTMLLGILFSNCIAQTDAIHQGHTEAQEEKSAKIMHVSKQDFPKENVINLLKGWGGMAVAINEIPAGTDFTPLLKSQKNGLCQVPHWGYLEKGKLKMILKDKSEEIITEGDVFYMPPGHTGVVLEDVRIIDFSPENEMVDLVNDVNKIVEELNKQKN